MTKSLIVLLTIVILSGIGVSFYGYSKKRLSIAEAGSVITILGLFIESRLMHYPSWPFLLACLLPIVLLRAVRIISGATRARRD